MARRPSVQKLNGLHVDLRGWDALRKAAPELGNLVVVAGVLEERYGKDPVEGTDLNMAQLYAIHEFGTEHIPERSSLRATLTDPGVHAGAAKIVGAAVADVVKVKTGAQRIKKLESTFSKVGVFLVNAIKERIRSGIAPPLAPSTLRQRERKGIVGVTPLLATRHLINALSWAVRPLEKKR